MNLEEEYQAKIKDIVGTVGRAELAKELNNCSLLTVTNLHQHPKTIKMWQAVPIDTVWHRHLVEITARNLRLNKQAS